MCANPRILTPYVVGVFACCSGGTNDERWERWVARHNACDEQSGCVLVSFAAPCDSAVAGRHFERAQRKAERLGSELSSSVFECGPGACRDGRCQVDCLADEDCVGVLFCHLGACVLPGQEEQCLDADEDGHGVGDTGDCLLCVSEARCERDCDDTDQAINPSLADTCDGKDNDCDGEVDEKIACEENFDCPEESHSQGPIIPFCRNGLCEYHTPVNAVASGEARCDEPVLCLDGERETAPEVCF